jgi:phosphodiesterase/alkaline phosphatase D-like protein
MFLSPIIQKENTMKKINSALRRIGFVICLCLAVLASLILTPELYAQAPTATTGAATGIGGAGATVNGTVNANGSSTTVTFEYGLTTEYGNTVPGVPSPVSGSSATPVTAILSGLDPTTTYHYRVVATNAGGTTYGADMTFTTTALSGTAPVAVTMPATGAGVDFATLNGMVLVYSTSTVVSFEWGTDTNYGNTITADQSPVNSGTLDPVTASLTGLANNTIYHYRVVVANINGTNYGTDMTFTIGTVGSIPSATTNAATGVGSITATLNGNVNANGASSVVTFEYGTTTGYGSVLTANPNPVSGSSDTPVSATLGSFLPNTEYHYRVSATNVNGSAFGIDMTFTTLPLPPTATTGAASGVGATAATLNGTVNANGGSTTVTFEYGGDTNYGITVTADQSPTTGTTNTAVSKALTGLVNGTTYHYRVVATNAGGTTYGLDMTFAPGITPPTVTTNAASGITTTAATLNGTVNANKSSTSTLFEYGTDTNYGRTTIAAPSPVTGATNTAISANVTNLTPNTTYHYRAVGSSTGGTTYGTDMTFTSGPGPSVTTNDASAIGTSGATLNGTVNANNENTTVTFEYGLSTSYGTTVTADQSPVTGTTNTAVSKAITGLNSSTTYHYRAVGQNASGTIYGVNKTFTTAASNFDAPTATTTSAMLVSTTGATLQGSVDSKNHSTTVTFEYGTDTSYGTTVTANGSPIQYADGALTLNKAITGLTAGVTYHYRVVAQNAYGTAYGADMTFSTSAPANPTATTNPAVPVISQGATIHGTVNANNSTIMAGGITFEYGTTTAYGSTVNGTPTTVSGTVGMPVIGILTGLVSNTTYHYRLKVVSYVSVSPPIPVTIYGADMTFYTGVNTPTATTNATSSIGATTATVNGTVNANNTSTTVTFEYGLDTAYGKIAVSDQSPVTGSTNTAVSNSLINLSPNTTYHYRVVAQNVNETVYGADMTFTTTGLQPTATTIDATAITGTGAMLNGIVSANNDNSTVIFRYGNNIGFGTVVTADQSPVTGNSLTPVSKAITGLTPNTHYFFRVDATNSAGTRYGETKVFFTGAAAPSVTTNAASGIGSTTATLNGSVIANNADATVTFEYGTTTAYGKTATATPGTVSGSVNTAVSSVLSGLASSTLYHYRVVAANGVGTTNGADVTFATAAANDTDGDGVPDGTEGTGDRDSDGTQNYLDYDPTGYFYDEADAKILAGGLIIVSGPGAISLIHNGSSGYYQFITDGTAGIYTISILALPPGYAWSSTCLVTPAPLDPTGQPNPYVLGNGEDAGNPGYLTSNACTQFFLQFDLEPGDPFVFNNNFPLKKQDPTAVSLTSLNASVVDEGVVINWITASEPNVAGFNIFRSFQETGDYEKVNETLISALGNATSGASYEYVDQPQQTRDYYYKLEAVALDGLVNYYGPVFVGLTSADMKKYTVPKEYFLSQNYPNPFNPQTTIEFGLPEPGFVEISIYNINGRLVRSLISQEKQAGNHRIMWDARDRTGIPLSSGLYFYKLEATNKISKTSYGKTLKMILMK